jgi:transposase
MARRVISGQSPKTVAVAFEVRVKTVDRWVKRFRAEGAG